MSSLGPGINPDGSLATDRPSETFARFTNRDAEQHLFRERIDAPPGGPLPILMFYGVAGQGKSWLLRQFRELVKPIAGLEVARFDFNEAGQRDTGSKAALAAIRRDLGGLAPRFDLTLGVIDGLDASASGASAGVKGDLAESGMADLLGLIDEIPVAGLIAKVLRLAGRRWLAHADIKTWRRWLKSGTGKSFCGRLGDVAESDPSGLGLFLIQSLAVDLMEFLPRRDGKGCRAVVFLDTFEHLKRRGLTGLQQYEQHEKWIFDLWANCHESDESGNPQPFLQVVIAGRDRLKWADPDFEGFDRRVRDHSGLEQHRIGGLSREDAGDFLLKCQINGPDLREAIFAASRDRETAVSREEVYHAYALGLCADTVFEERERSGDTDPDPESFHLSPEKAESLEKRFLNSLAAVFARKIRRLALTPRFDRGAVESLFDGSDPDMKELDVEKVFGYTFVEPVSDESPIAKGAWYTLHPLMRESILPSVGSAELSSWGEEWRQYWAGRVEEPFDEYRGLAWYNRWLQDRKQALQDWISFAEMTRLNLMMSDHSRLLDWWTQTGIECRPARTEEESDALIALGVECTQSSQATGSENFVRSINAYGAALEFATSEGRNRLSAKILNNLGNALQERGICLEGEQGTHLLEKAVSAYTRALAVFSREEDSYFWAMTKSNLGNTLKEQGARMGDEVGFQHLQEAVEMHRSVLQEFSRENHPQEWSTQKLNLGNTLIEQGVRIGGREGVELLKEASGVFREALEIRTRETWPEDWAVTQNSLGIALNNQGIRCHGSKGIRLIDKGIEAYRAALEIRTRDRFPQDWAMTQNNLGSALMERADRTDGEEGPGFLQESIDAFQSALEVYRRADLPQKWAMTQNNLSIALKSFGTRFGGANEEDLLAKSVFACQSALEVFQRDKFPQQWAMTQNSLGGILEKTGIRAGGEAGEKLLEEAVNAFRAALTVYTYDELPQQWAMTQNNLGNALKAWGIRSSADAVVHLLEESVSALKNALKVRDRDALPQDWAQTQNNLGIAMEEMGIRTPGDSGIALLRDAIAIYRSVLMVHTRADLPKQWAGTQNDLGIALKGLAMRCNGKEKANLLGESIAAYRAALEIQSSEFLSHDWAMTQNNLGIAQREQSECGDLEIAQRRALIVQAIIAHKMAAGIWYGGEESSTFYLTAMGNMREDVFALAGGEAAYQRIIEERGEGGIINLVNTAAEEAGLSLD